MKTKIEARKARVRPSNKKVIVDVVTVKDPSRYIFGPYVSIKDVNEILGEFGASLALDT